ncbi:MAG: hypothetical protein JWP89_3526 [Schlesneria sp.]|nr:hypothetical protein [Schlesneria sp.]
MWFGGYSSNSAERVRLVLGCVILTACLAGCGTTRSSDTLRTGTEQLLLSTAIERAINDMDLSVMNGKTVYFDPQYLKGVSDEGYIISSLRQRLLAEGALLKTSRDDAAYIVEARAGTVGTNRQDVLIGIPQVNLPTGAAVAGAPSVIPEIPFAKKTQQRGIVKLAAFAYNQETGQAVWQSGTYPITADARDTWILGTGPFQRGSIYAGTNLAGNSVFSRKSKSDGRTPAPGMSVVVGNSFPEDPDLIEAAKIAKAEKKDKGKENSVAPASFTPAVPPSQPQPGRIPSTTPSSTTSSTPASGFSNTATDTKFGTGGSTTAAGLMILQKRAGSTN